jgi:hypothetical protein
VAVVEEEEEEDITFIEIDLSKTTVGVRKTELPQEGRPLQQISICIQVRITPL